MRGSHGSCSCSQENQENQERQEARDQCRSRRDERNQGQGRRCGPQESHGRTSCGQDRYAPDQCRSRRDRGARRDGFQEVLHIQWQPGGRTHYMCWNDWLGTRTSLTTKGEGGGLVQPMQELSWVVRLHSSVNPSSPKTHPDGSTVMDNVLIIYFYPFYPYRIVIVTVIVFVLILDMRLHEGSILKEFEI